MAERKEGYVPLIFARDWSQAEFFRAILADHEITVVLEEPGEVPGAEVPVLVAEEQLEEAQDVLVEYSEELEEDEFEEEEDEFEEDEELETLEGDEYEIEDDEFEDEELF